ncbi:hypothetical protein V1525DRAFT_396469 [Lipomyces kononenkoae]|uniref:Uncharacterized protein n=1 Tax=Lipomyces kononenkoae TaxID=34357 RepID=A0ACC3T7N2_LIPKO
MAGTSTGSGKLSRAALRQNLSFRLNQLHDKFEINRRLTARRQFEYTPEAKDEQTVAESAGFIAYNVWRKHADSLRKIFKFPRANAYMAPGVRVTGMFRSPSFKPLDVNEMNMPQTYDYLRTTSHKASRGRFILNTDIYKLYTNFRHIEEMDDEAIKQYNLIRAKWFSQLIEEHARKDNSFDKELVASTDNGTAPGEYSTEQNQAPA